MKICTGFKHSNLREKKQVDLSLYKSVGTPSSADLQEKPGQKDETLGQENSTRDSSKTPWKDPVTGNLGLGKAKQQEHLHFFKRAHLSQVSWLDLWPSRRLHLWGFWNSPWRGCNHSKSSVLALVIRSWDLTSFLIQTWLSVAVLRQLTSGGPCSEQMPKETGILGCPHPGLPPQLMPPGHTYCPSAFWKEEERKQ